MNKTARVYFHNISTDKEYKFWDVFTKALMKDGELLNEKDYFIKIGGVNYYCAFLRKMIDQKEEEAVVIFFKTRIDKPLVLHDDGTYENISLDSGELAEVSFYKIKKNILISLKSSHGPSELVFEDYLKEMYKKSLGRDRMKRIISFNRLYYKSVIDRFNKCDLYSYELAYATLCDIEDLKDGLKDEVIEYLDDIVNVVDNSIKRGLAHVEVKARAENKKTLPKALKSAIAFLRQKTRLKKMKIEIIEGGLKVPIDLLNEAIKYECGYSGELSEKYLDILNKAEQFFENKEKEVVS